MLHHLYPFLVVLQLLLHFKFRQQHPHLCQLVLYQSYSLLVRSGMSSNQQSVPITSAQPLTSASAPTQTYPKLSRLEEKNMLKEELSLVGQTKVICSLDLLLDLFKKCQHPGCTKYAAVKKKYLNGPTVVIKWSCCLGRKGTFSSSRDVNAIYCNNLQLAASVVFREQFCKSGENGKFSCLVIISDSTFYRMQRLYFIPAIDEWWSWQRATC